MNNSVFLSIVALLSVVSIAHGQSKSPIEQAEPSHKQWKLLNDAEPPVTLTGYRSHRLCGWPVLISQQLREQHPELLATAIQLAGQQLNDVAERLPANVIEKLRTVPIWFSPEYPGIAPTAEYHPSAGWLVRHQRPKEMARCIQLTNIRIFERECKRMPMLMLHELAHAYHDQVLGTSHPEIVAAFDAADEAGIYDQVKRNNGRVEKAYAITNHKEYFAELSECFFGTNDFFPFNREELKQHDPRAEKLLSRLWETE